MALGIRTVALLAVLLPACGGEDNEKQPPAPQPVPQGDGHQLGDGTAGSAQLTSVYKSDTPRQATDLAFHPLRPELWVLLREFVDGPPCTQAEQNGCDELEGSVAIVSNAGAASPTAVWKKDANAWHFMRTPTGLDFGGDGTFATCSEARTGNFEDETYDYNGPSLWSSDPAIFTLQPPGGNGSHLDMLHETPHCMGIGHERANVYWAFNGKLGALDRYDFAQPHVPGASDHSDGQLTRWVEGSLLRKPGVPSHLVYEPETARVYVADTGHGRVVALDTKSGSPGDEFFTAEEMASARSVTGGQLIEIVAPGVLQAPSGLAIKGKVVFVTDNATSKIHAFDLDGKPLRSLDTGLPAGSLAGIAISPDDRAYIVNLAQGQALRIDVR
jgi:hypothetical protein